MANETVTEEQRILDIKVKYKDAIQSIASYKKKIDELKTAEAELKEQKKAGAITDEEYQKQMVATDSVITQYKDNIRVLRKELQNNLRQEQENEGSLKSLRAQLSNATKAYDELSKAEREGAKGQALQKHINEITNELKLAEEQTQRYYRNVGNYYNSMLDLAADLQHVVPMGGGGGVGEFTNSVVNLGTNIKNFIPNIKAFGTTLLGLASNPVFLSLAGITGAGMAFKWWFDYNKGLMEATRLTKEFTGYTGEALETMRNSISATADTMGKDFKEVLSTADALMSQYHLSGEEAMKVINEGFASGADLSGNMLSKIQQYAPTFHDAGISADELVAILQQTRSGIFSDAGMDLITMASKKIREMSTATSTSLDAIGISSKKVQKDLSDGTKNTFDIIQEIAKRLKSLPNDSKEVGEVLKDVFGRQGASAGLQLIEQLDTMSTSLNEVKKQTGAWGDVQLENIKLQKELNTYMSSMFDFSQKGFASIITAGKQFGTKVLIQIMKGLFNTINYFIDWYNNSLLLRGVINSLGTSFRLMWNAIKLVCNLGIDAFKRMGSAAKGILDILEGIVTFDLSKAQKGFKEVFDISGTIKEAWHDIRNAGVEIGNSFADGFENTVHGRLNHLRLANLDGGATSSDPTKGNSGGKHTNAGAGKTGTGKHGTGKTGTTKEDKTEEERQKQQQKELQEAIAKIQFEYNEKVMDAKKRFLAGMYENDQDYEADCEQLEKEMIARSLDAYVAAGKMAEDKAQEMQDKLLDVLIKAKQTMKAQVKAVVDGINKEFEALEKKRKESNILSGGTGDDEDTSARLERYKSFLEQKISMTSNSVEVQKELQKELHDTEIGLKEDSNKKQAQLTSKQLETMAQMISTMGDGLADFFSEQDKSLHSFLKSMLTSLLDAIKIAIDAYYAQILAREIASKSWGGVASTAALMALINAAFAGAKAAIKGFATGGYVQGAGTGTSDSIPARLSNGESVMTAKATSMFSPILSAFNQLGGGVPIVVSSNQSNIGIDMLAAAVAKGYSMAPRPVVSVEDINKTQRRVKTIESLATI